MLPTPRTTLIPAILLTVLASAACGEVNGTADAVTCCFKVKTDPSQLFWDQGFVCLEYPVCADGETNKAQICDPYCPAAGEELSGIWAVPPLSGSNVRIVYGCETDLLHTEPYAGAGDDEVSEGLECVSSNHSVDPGAVRFAGPMHFATASKAGDIELSIGATTEAPNYELEGTFYLDHCGADLAGTPWCDLTLFHLVLETTSTMSLGRATVLESKAFLAQPVTTRVNMSTGQFEFAAPDSFVVGVSWEERGATSNVERGANLSNGAETITGMLDLGETPSILFDGTLVAPGGSLEIMNVAARVDNQAPEADESATDPLIECAPSSHDPSKTWATLDARASLDVDDNIKAYLWYVDGELVEQGEVVDVLLDVGLHEVTLLVYDDYGAYSSRPFTVDVDDPAGACA